MPFKKESISLFIKESLNKNTIFICFYNWRQTIFYCIIISFWAVWFLCCLCDYFYFKKILFRFLYFLIKFFNHALISVLILTKFYLFFSLYIWLIIIPVIFIKNRCIVIRVKNTNYLLFWCWFHFCFLLWILN